MCYNSVNNIGNVLLFFGSAYVVGLYMYVLYNCFFLHARWIKLIMRLDYYRHLAQH